MNSTKPWWASVTIWLNLIGLLVAFLTGVTPLLPAGSDPRIAAAILSLTGFLNLVRRLLDPNQPALTMTDKRNL